VPGDSVSIYVNATEANEENITFRLFNSTGYQVRTTTFTDETRIVTWNLLDEGTYYYNVTITDVVSHSDSTSTRSIIIDNTFPSIKLHWLAISRAYFCERLLGCQPPALIALSKVFPPSVSYVIKPKGP